MLRIFLYLFLAIYIAMFNFPSWGVSIGCIGIVNSFVFWTITIAYLRQYKKGNYLGFELFFAISYWLSCFLGTVFDLQSLPFIGDYLFGYPEDHIVKSHALSMVGYIALLIALSVKGKKNEKKELPFVSSGRVVLINNICLAFLLFYLATGGYKMFFLYSQIGVGLGRNSLTEGLFQYLVIIYTIAIIYNFLYIKSDYRNVGYFGFIKALDKRFVFLSLIFIVMMFLSGYRSMLFQIGLPCIIMYHLCVQKIKTKWLILGLVCGFLLMSIVGQTRAEGISIESILSVDLKNTRGMVQDYIPVNGALYFLVEYVSQHGITYGSNAFLQIASIVPFLQGFLVTLFGEDTFTNSSSLLYTAERTTSPDSGMGTNIIGDLYYTFGFFGVVLLMFLFGVIVRETYKNKNNIFSLFIYIMLFGNALFAPRVEYFYIVRSISFGLIMLFFFREKALNKK